ncbi:hypothetical protein YTPLAS18_21870 [Nitrospira sp.]|nr:hypothetical protein YTPLAS18_21870 [Nitrospira sp.]
MSVEDLAHRAEQLGLDAILLSENFTLRYEYGLPPLRQLLRVAVSYPSLLDYGIERYLREVRDTQARHPNLLLIPGIEAAPFSYWTGSLLTGDLTLHDTQKNLLVFGLSEPAQYRGLPAQGNPWSYQLDGVSLVSVTVPVLCLLGGIGVVLRRRRAIRDGHSLTVGPGWVALATALFLFGLSGAWAAWPPGHTAFSAYDGQEGYAPYQHFIDQARKSGGLTFWSMTEARDFTTRDFGPLGTVTVRTDPHPEALILTKNLSGFGGLYQEAHHVVDPGGLWDQLIEQYARGHRPDPPVMLGEIAFHSLAQAKKDLDQVLTVVSVERRSVPSLMESIRTGRLYAVERQKPGYSLRLDTFALQCASVGSVAMMGDVVDPAQCAQATVRIRVSATDGGEHPITVRVVRASQVVSTTAGHTPLTADVVDTVRPDEPTAYRVLVTGSGELLSNPIYLRPTETRP